MGHGEFISVYCDICFFPIFMGVIGRKVIPLRKFWVGEFVGVARDDLWEILGS